MEKLSKKDRIHENIFKIQKPITRQNGLSHREGIKMIVRLKIAFDGEHKSLFENRLSIGLFVEPLALLLKAYRRIASDSISRACEGKRGRYKKEAKRLDLEIESLSNGSTEVSCICSQEEDEQQSFFNDLHEESMALLLKDLEEESKGIPRNYSVRKFLKSIPGEVSSQKYSLYHGETLRKEVKIKEANLIEDEDISDIPLLKHIEGFIIGVGFEPGSYEIKIKNQDEIVSGYATDTLVQKALLLRGIHVHSLLVGRSNQLKYLWIKKIEEKVECGTNKECINQIIIQWDNVLRRLSQ